MSVKLLRKQTGFTIIELLIVIVVIGVLAAITIVAYNGISQRGQNAARVSAAKAAYNVIKIHTTTAGSDAAILSPIAVNASACYGKSLPDLNSDGIGDCNYQGATVFRSNNAAVDALLESTGSYGKVNYPAITTTTASVFLSPIIVNFPSTIDGRSAALQLRYTLQGDAQDCGLRTLLGLGGTSYTATNPNNYTGINSGLTNCVVDMSYQ